MAKIQNNVMMRGVTGLFGDQLVLKRDKARRTILSNRPHFGENRVFTPAQRAQQERFRAARVYARQAKQVSVAVLGASVAVLEQGPATAEGEDRWVYRTTAAAVGITQVVVRAEDLPGYVTERRISYPAGSG